MPNNIVSQPIADRLPGPGADPAIAHDSLSRRELFTGVCRTRLARGSTAFRRILSGRATAPRSPRAARNRRRRGNEDARR